MTEFTKLNSERIGLETSFRYCVASNNDGSKLTITNAEGIRPDRYDNVLWLGRDKNYGDVFKVWKDGKEDDFTIFFGTAGTEFK